MMRTAKLAALAVLVGLYAALGWIVGVVVLAVAVVMIVRRVVRLRRALAPAIPCPWCRTEVAQYGEFSCGACHARTRGWIWRCTCGAWSGHFECPACALSIPNPALGGG